MKYLLIFKASVILSFCCFFIQAKAQTTKTDTAALRVQIVEAFNNQPPDSVLVLVDAFLKIDAKQWDILDILTLTQINTDAHDKAFQTALRAMECAPNAIKMPLISKYGFIYFNERSDYNRAKQYFEAGIKVDKTDWRCFTGLGLCATIEENYAKAEELLGEAIKYSTDTAITSTIYIAYAYALHRNGKSLQALDYISRFLTICKDDYCVQGYVVRQEIYKDIKEYDKALQDVNHLLSINKEDGQAYEMRAFVYDAMNKNDLALKDAEQALGFGVKSAFDSLSVKYAPPLSNLPLKAGTKIVYRVEGTDEPHELILTLETLTAEKIEFSYRFSSDEEMHGTVTMHKKALESGQCMHNFFMGNGEVINLQADSIAFFASRTMLQALKTKQKTEVDPFCNGEKLEFRQHEHQQSAFKMNGKYVKIKSIQAINESDDVLYMFTVADDPNFPLIIALEMGWSLRLVRIE
jgi:tetratricopeptide (TPR) repeat protein